MTNEVDEMSAASRGSQPVGWGAVASDGSVVCMMRRRADVASYVVDGTPIVALYRQPQPTLTDAERESLKKVLRRVREDYFTGRFADSVQIAAVIDGLLERTK